MIQFQGKIPITIHTAFWLFAALIGFVNSMSLIGTLVWVVVILVSVLFHEMGHALTALYFGQKPRIELVALGGLTYHEGGKLGKGKQFLIVLNGPIFGFLLFGISMYLMKITPAQSYLWMLISSLVWVNLFWTIVNLLPIMPLDGGQLLKIALERFWGVKGVRAAFFISMCFAGFLSLTCFLYKTFLLGAFLFLFAYQGFDAWRASKNLTQLDEEDELKKEIMAAENLIQLGDEEGAIKALEVFREKVKKGILFNIATQHLAFLLFKAQKPREAYMLLKPLRADISEEGLVILHNAASMLGDHGLVEDLSGVVFQVVPSIDNAIRNALALAAQNKAEAAVGWLQTAKENGCEDLEKIFQNPSFDLIRENALFQKFSHNLKLE